MKARFVDVFKSVRGDMVLVNDQEFARKFSGYANKNIFSIYG